MVRLIPQSCRLNRWYWKSQLRFWGGVVIPVALQEMTEGEIEGFGPVCSSRVIVPSQLEGLRHVTQGFLHSLVSNLLAISV
jgi:hypothetical protein